MIKKKILFYCHARFLLTCLSVPLIFKDFSQSFSRHRTFGNVILATLLVTIPPGVCFCNTIRVATTYRRSEEWTCSLVSSGRQNKWQGKKKILRNSCFTIWVMHMVSKHQIVDKCDKLTGNFPKAIKALPNNTYRWLANWFFYETLLCFLLFAHVSSNCAQLGAAPAQHLHPTACSPLINPNNSPPQCSSPWKSRGTWRPSSCSWRWAEACGPGGSRHPDGTPHLKPGWEKSIHLVECHRSPSYRGGKDRRGRRPDVRAHTQTEDTHRDIDTGRQTER